MRAFNLKDTIIFNKKWSSVMDKDIEHLFNFQMKYVLGLVENIPQELVYEKQGEFNSAGWVLGHLCVEGVDALVKIAGDYPLDKSWLSLFSYKGELKSGAEENLPDLKSLTADFESIYKALWEQAITLDKQALSLAPQSELLQNIFPTTSSWLAHHLTTHIAIHAGNLSVWKNCLV
jgi:hypothetical protein